MACLLGYDRCSRNSVAPPSPSDILSPSPPTDTSLRAITNPTSNMASPLIGKEESGWCTATEATYDIAVEPYQLQTYLAHLFRRRSGSPSVAPPTSPRGTSFKLSNALRSIEVAQRMIAGLPNMSQAASMAEHSTGTQSSSEMFKKAGGS